MPASRAGSLTGDGPTDPDVAGMPGPELAAHVYTASWVET